MKGLQDWLAGLPLALRWGVVGVVGLLVVVLSLAGVRSWQERQDEASRNAFGPVMTVAHRALNASESGALDEASRALTQFLKDYPRAEVSAQAWYFLGGVELRRRQWDAAASAFAAAASRDRSGSIGALSRLGEGTAYESKGDLSRAVDAYQQGLAGRTPKGFLYGELLLAKARAQEQAKDSSGAVATYKQYLAEVPSPDRAEEVRIRLALLGSSG